MATYDSDVAIWADEQAAHIRARRFHLLDLEHLADEIEDVAKSKVGAVDLPETCPWPLADVLNPDWRPA